MGYENGKIYKLVCNTTGLQYIGSTIEDLHRRKRQHEKDYKNWKNGIYHYITSFKILEKNTYDIVLILEYPCENKQELERKEREYIESLECVNKYIPTRTQKEYYNENKEQIQQYKKDWYNDNKEKHKKQQKEWREKNRDKMLEQMRKYYEKTKEKRKKTDKEYYEKNKDIINEINKERVICDICNIEMNRSSLTRHKKTAH